jgi:hypothetical protein
MSYSSGSDIAAAELIFDRLDYSSTLFSSVSYGKSFLSTIADTDVLLKANLQDYIWHFRA